MPSLRQGVWFVRSLFIVTTLTCAGAHPSDQTAQFRVMIYNIHAGRDSNGADNLSRVATIIREANADLVLLQEVDRGTERSGGQDQLNQIEGLTGLHGVFGSTLEFQGGQYGIGILSRWPDIALMMHSLPLDPPQQRAGGSYEPRGLLQAAVASPHGVIYVLNTHLDPSPDESNRLQEANRVRAIAEALRNANSTVVIGGDFNALPETATIRTITSGGFRDSWVECGDGQGMGYPAGAPSKRIDYLFISSDLTCVDARVIGSDASDHRPVLFGLRYQNR